MTSQLYILNRVATTKKPYLAYRVYGPWILYTRFGQIRFDNWQEAIKALDCHTYIKGMVNV